MRQTTAANGESASLSLSHNSIESIASHVGVEQRERQSEFHEGAEKQGSRHAFKLSGSQKKTAYALERNVQWMCDDDIERMGLRGEDVAPERIGFLTLTVGDKQLGRIFAQVWDANEAGRRINSLISNLLRDLFGRIVIVTERHKSGAIHFHLIVETHEDIRGGFDFEAFLNHRNARKAGFVDHEAERRYKRSATPALRRLWAILLRRLEGFGFGRAELTPIYKTAEAISRYVAKYVEKNLYNRGPEDRRKKLVRYSGWKGADGKTKHHKPNTFSWATPAACQWRRQAQAVAHTHGIFEKEAMRAAVGPRWAYHVTAIMAEGVFETTGANDARGLGNADDAGEWAWYRRGGLDGREWAAECLGKLMESYKRGKLDPRPTEKALATWERELTDAECQTLLNDMADFRQRQLLAGMDFGEDEEEMAHAYRAGKQGGHLKGTQ